LFAQKYEAQVEVQVATVMKVKTEEEGELSPAPIVVAPAPIMIYDPVRIISYHLYRQLGYLCIYKEFRQGGGCGAEAPGNAVVNKIDSCFMNIADH